MLTVEKIQVAYNVLFQDFLSHENCSHLIKQILKLENLDRLNWCFLIWSCMVSHLQVMVGSGNGSSFVALTCLNAYTARRLYQIRIHNFPQSRNHVNLRCNYGPCQSKTGVARFRGRLASKFVQISVGLELGFTILAYLKS